MSYMVPYFFIFIFYFVHLLVFPISCTSYLILENTSFIGSSYIFHFYYMFYNLCNVFAATKDCLKLFAYHLQIFVLSLHAAYRVSKQFVFMVHTRIHILTVSLINATPSIREFRYCDVQLRLRVKRSFDLVPLFIDAQLGQTVETDTQHCCIHFSIYRQANK